MVWFLTALATMLGGGLLARLVGRSPRAACLAGATGAVAGGAAALVASIGVLATGRSECLRCAWSWPLGSANMELDALSAVFAAVIAVVTMPAAVYGSAYWQAHGAGRNLGVSWFFFNVLAASMLVVVAARNGVLFLVGWELMSLASFFLVIQDDRKEGTRRAGWIYLAAMHLGTAFLLVLFLLLGQGAGTLDFEQFSTAAAPGGVFFLLALLGFGTKAGFVPMHVWLPEAHPAAPSHVSAVMSGVMIKTGVYGLLRTLTWLGPPEAWWGWTLLAAGLVSGVLGVLYALAQSDLKRLLAYCSVENIGVIALGLGVGLLGISRENPAMAVLGLTGCLLHVVNHAVFKSLLFLGAGSVLHAAGTLELDRLGGLFKRMPVTGTCFLAGSAAICGLPPLNGFVSEFLIFLGATAGLGAKAQVEPAWALMGAMVAGGLALIGGLAAVCFTKAFGIAFLGEPRSAGAAQARETGAAMWLPMAALAGLCVLIGASAPLWPLVLHAAVGVLVPEAMRPAALESLGRSAGPLAGVVLGAWSAAILAFALVVVRKRLLAGRRVEEAVTWDCGYVAPAPRMQYTASSFARPVVLLFRALLRPRDAADLPRGPFPERAGLQTRVSDLFLSRLYKPAFMAFPWATAKLRWLQEGRIQIYVLYIALTILVLLIWKLG